MSVRRIKANHAEITGEYVMIEKRSIRSLVAFFVFLISMVVGVFIFYDYFELVLAGSFLLAIIIAVFSPGKEVRLIPRVDLIEIKSYPSERKVTVVLDDERTKRRQPVTTPKKD